MPSLKDIKRRIVTVKNMQQIMKAMNLVATAKMQRNRNQLGKIKQLEDRAKDAGGVGNFPRFTEVVNEQFKRLREIVRYMDIGDCPYFTDIPTRLKVSVRDGDGNNKKRDKVRIAYVVIAGDQGLCGGYNANVLGKASEEIDAWKAFLEEKLQAEHPGIKVEPYIIPIGAKTLDYFVRQGYEDYIDEDAKEGAYVGFFERIFVSSMVDSSRLNSFNEAVESTAKIAASMGIEGGRIAEIRQGLLGVRDIALEVAAKDAEKKTDRDRSGTETALISRIDDSRQVVRDAAGVIREIPGQLGSEVEKAYSAARKLASDALLSVANEIGQKLNERFKSEFEADIIDEVHLVYTQFESVLSHTPRGRRLLPFRWTAEGDFDQEFYGQDIDRTKKKVSESIFEPGLDTFMRKAGPEYLAMYLRGAFVESAACEQAARMVSTDAASNNASEIIDDLTLQFNRKRQSIVTQEISEIVSGANVI